MYVREGVKKANHHRCRTDKTNCTILCPKCKTLTGHSAWFRSPENLWRHLFQVHNYEKNEYPSIPLVIDVLDEISIALKNDIPLDTIALTVKWNMLI